MKRIVPLLLALSLASELAPAAETGLAPLAPLVPVVRYSTTAEHFPTIQVASRGTQSNESDHHQAVVYVSDNSAGYGGSGTAIFCSDKNGNPVCIVATAAHVVVSGNASVVFKRGPLAGKRYRCRMVLRHATHDVCLLQVNIPFTPEGNPGTLCLALAPVGKIPKENDVLEVCGYGGGRWRHFLAYMRGLTRHESPYTDTLSVDFQSVSGDSGGPIFNSNHELVAVLWGGPLYNASSTEMICTQGTFNGTLHTLFKQAGFFPRPSACGPNGCSPGGGSGSPVPPQASQQNPYNPAPYPNPAPEPEPPPKQPTSDLANQIKDLQSKLEELSKREPIPGPAGPIGPAGPQGPTGPAGECDASQLTELQILIADLQARLDKLEKPIADSPPEEPKPTEIPRYVYVTAKDSPACAETDAKIEQMIGKGYPITVVTLLPHQVKPGDVPQFHNQLSKQTIAGPSNVMAYLANLVRP